MLEILINTVKNKRIAQQKKFSKFSKHTDLRFTYPRELNSYEQPSCYIRNSYKYSQKQMNSSTTKIQKFSKFHNSYRSIDYKFVFGVPKFVNRSLFFPKKTVNCKFVLSAFQVAQNHFNGMLQILKKFLTARHNLKIKFWWRLYTIFQFYVFSWQKKKNCKTAHMQLSVHLSLSWDTQKKERNATRLFLPPAITNMQLVNTRFSLPTQMLLLRSRNLN